MREYYFTLFLLEIQNNHSLLKTKTKTKTSCIYCVPDTMLAVEDTLVESSNLCPQRAHSIVVRTGFLEKNRNENSQFSSKAKLFPLGPVS